MPKKYWWKDETVLESIVKTKYVVGRHYLCYDEDGNYNFYILATVVCPDNLPEEERKIRFDDVKYIWSGHFGDKRYYDNELKSKTLKEAKAELEMIYYNMLSDKVKTLNEAKRLAMEEEEKFWLYIKNKAPGEPVERSGDVISANETTGIKHGKWECSNIEDTAICSVCGYEHYLGTYHQYATNGCPNCLAVMDLDNVNEVNIELIIKELDRLFTNYGKHTDVFTVDFDENSDCLYAYYTPRINDCGYVVLNDFLVVSETSKENLQYLKDYLDKNNIHSRNGFEWEVNWGYEKE